MKNTFFYAIICVFLTNMASFAQQAEPCATDRLHQELLKSSPLYKANFLKNQQQIKTFIQDSKKSRVAATAETVYTIPLVVHVLEPAVGSSIMTDAEINTMISNLNTQLQAGVGYTESQDINVEFALAKRDPNCNATTGIVRVNMSGNAAYVANGVNYSNSNGISELTAKATSNWGNVNYYNLWIVNEIDGKVTNGVVGYAYFPGASADRDGALMIAPRLKDAASTLLVHELGHAFGIYHTFEGYSGTAPNYNCPPNTNPSEEGDLCADTEPMHYGGTYVSFNCTTGFNTTNPCTGTPYGNLYKNIMNYTPDVCSLLFTADQKARFRAGLLTGRPSLVSSKAGLPVENSGINITSCLPSNNYSLGDFFGIASVNFNNQLKVISDTPFYDSEYFSDRTCFQKVSFTEGSLNPISFEVFNNSYVKSYIDYNNDGDFIDSGELVNTGISTGTDFITNYSFNYQVPSIGVLLNQEVRLRIITDPNPNSNSCSLLGIPIYGSGQVEDYSIKIVPLCTPPAAPSISAFTIETGQTATLNATGCAGGTITWFDVATGGTSIATGTSLTTGVLNANKTYYASCTIGCESTSRGSGLVTVLQCVANKTLGPNPIDNISSGTSQILTSNGITAQNKVSGGNVTYSAGKNVLLLPGFTAENGAVFVSMIGGCSN